MTTITDLPDAPSRADPANFSTEADAFLGALPTFGTECNLVASEINTAKTNTDNNVIYSEEWAQKAEDSPISVAAGGDGSTEFSALHHSAKANAQRVLADSARSGAEEWAQKAEDSPISVSAGGDGSTDFSALHYSAKAAASAATAIASPYTNGTSTTSLTIATGAQSLTIQTGKAIVVGMEVVIARTSAPTNRMSGVVTSYVTGTGALGVTVNSIYGSGTFTDWTVSLSAPFDASVTQTWTGDHTFTGHQTFNEITESVYSGLATSGTMTIDPANGTVQYVTLTGNVTSVTDSLTDGQMVTLMVNDGTAYSISGGDWANIDWVGGSAPILATSGYSVIELWKVNSVLYGSFVGVTE